MASDWDAQYQHGLRSFLATDAGAVLIERMRAIEYHNFITAKDEHMVQRARGFSEARTWLESLSRTSTRTNDGSTQTLNETDSQAEPKGEPSLAELLAP